MPTSTATALLLLLIQRGVELEDYVLELSRERAIEKQIAAGETRERVLIDSNALSLAVATHAEFESLLEEVHKYIAHEKFTSLFRPTDLNLKTWSDEFIADGLQKMKAFVDAESADGG